MRHPSLGPSLMVLILACATQPASSPPVAFDASRAQVFQAAGGAALTGPSSAAPASVVARFLRDHGSSEATVASLREVARSQGRQGAQHLRMEQEVGGLRVLGAYLKATLTARGELVHVVQNLAPAGGKVRAAAVTERDALAATLAALHPSVRDVPAVAAKRGNLTTFRETGFFDPPPTAERVALLLESGELAEGFLVETWTARDNQLNHTTVDGRGKVVANELRTANDSYRVFPENPAATPQVVVPGPGSTTESPAGWLSPAAQRTVDIAGNNVRAYLDVDANDAPDPGGDPVVTGDFLALADLSAAPTEAVNQAAAIQNLFYLTNVVHDVLYRAGFDEAAGNFQEDNFGRGGHPGDSVRAEGQDGGGLDNANFATPPDGRNPRMQMYLWTGKGSHQLVIDPPSPAAGTYRAEGAAFGPPLDATGVAGDVALVDDEAGTPSDACDPIPADLTGRIALVDRGTCTFVVKVKNAQAAGAVAVIVANNRGDSIFTMGGTDATITIPSVFIGGSDGAAVKAGLPAHGTVRLTDPPPLQRDGSLDSDIVWHEYGHGLTWRMIGTMQGPLSGAVGEGMSDVLAIVMNGDDVVAEYSFDDPLGIRRFPYDAYPLTYGSVQGTEVHDDGEVYAAIGWRMFRNYDRAGLSKEVLLDDLIDGMNFTPGSPKFEDMRDGILASIASVGGGRECLVWEAFAHFGVGVGAAAQAPNGNGLTAQATPPLPTVRVSESFAVPEACRPAP